MLQRALHWLITISLVTHALSFTIAMSSAHASGLWTISCAGNPMLLPIPGESENSIPMGHCLYCSDSPEPTVAIPAAAPLFVTQAAENIPARDCLGLFKQFTDCHPARAPPVIH